MNTLYRSQNNRVIAGVCGGLAEYLRMDPLLMRILFIVIGSWTGVGVVAYILMWLFVPVEGATFANRDEMVRQNANELRDRAQDLGRDAQTSLNATTNANRLLIVGGALVAIGLLILLSNLGLLAWMHRLWPLALVAVGVLILVKNLRGRE